MRRLLKFGFLTAAIFVGSAVTHAATTTLTGTVRDFVSSQSEGNTAPGGPITYNNDFENVIANDRGIVKSTLGADGTPVYDDVTHPAGTVTTHGKTQFDTWYHNTPGVNTSIPYSITLDDTGHPGVYSYSNTSFFPIANQGFGGNPNFSFTYQIATEFTYSGGEHFTFDGDDDVFVFINKQLVIDLGGVHGGESETVDLDLLGLTTGHDYDLDVFFAERHTSGSDFAMETSLKLTTRPPSVPEGGSVFGLLGSASALLLAARKFKKA